MGHMSEDRTKERVASTSWWPKWEQEENAVEFKLTEEFSRKHPVFPVSLVKPYFQTEEDEFCSRKKNPTPLRNSGIGGLPWTCEENYQGQEDQT
ncbi:hypothetical protein O181_032504 [Austropuccinia psidii MF-1]|uniref:Uncharacterized protein n=1 Tax=Austropuccinia psidii MF-1 TaxID=1389203 RepID=A0A9Q3H7L2_9BASI|nr:hypothetical protein [Austropuccinia psidii MF-1]